MATSFDDLLPSLKCQSCGLAFNKTNGWLQAHDYLICGCGHRTEWRPEQIAAGKKLYNDLRKKAIQAIRKR